MVNLGPRSLFDCYPRRQSRYDTAPAHGTGHGTPHSAARRARRARAPWPDAWPDAPTGRADAGRVETKALELCNPLRRHERGTMSELNKLYSTLCETTNIDTPWRGPGRDGQRASAATGDPSYATYNKTTPRLSPEQALTHAIPKRRREKFERRRSKFISGIPAGLASTSCTGRGYGTDC